MQVQHRWGIQRLNLKNINSIYMNGFCGFFICCYSFYFSCFLCALEEHDDLKKFIREIKRCICCRKKRHIYDPIIDVV